jgi:hypothetical protein
MNSLEHFILTRFNAPLKSLASSGQQTGGDAGWLTRRFELFERVCLDSVRRQTEGTFQWLVFMDWGTPLAFKERMAALTVRHEFLRPVYCSQFDDEIALAEIRRREAPGCIRITTRLDSDHAIHPRMVEKIQQVVRANASPDVKQGYSISFPIGCVERKGDFYIQRKRNNSSLSFVSAPENARTVLAAAEDGPAVLKYTRPMWCQVIHGDNSDVSPSGVYWPWGGSSEFAPGVTNGFCRSWLWQCAEVVRSSAQCFLKR